MAIDLAIHYARTVERHSYEYANEALSSIHQKLCIDDLNLCEETEALQKTAKRLAARRRYTSARFDIATETHQACLKIVNHYRITPPTVKMVTWHPP